jgi:excinuclease UvrABC nuclease subunit
LLAHSIPFSPDHPADFFVQFPAAPAVFALRGSDESAEPYVSKTANLRKRLQRLLAPPESQSKRLNLRERTARINYSLTGSDFESVLLLYQTLRQEFPDTYQRRLRLRPAPVIRLNLENEYPRAYVTTRIGKFSGRSLYYGPFRSRAVADKFLNDSLDLFKMRRCTFDLNPDPSFPGCVYSEMKMCLAPCFKGCTDEAYATEVARVQEYFDSGGQSLLRELEAERERLSAKLDFEGAAAQHAKVAKIKGILSACDEICGRLDRLDASIIQPSSETKTVALFRFHGGELLGPAPVMMESESVVSEDIVSGNIGSETMGSETMSSHDQAQPAQDPANPLPEKQVDTISAKNLESNIRVALQSLVPSGGQRAQRFSEELAILKRWYYRTHKVGETFFVNDRGELPLRRMARGATRVYRGEKETPALPTVEEQQPS